MASQVVGSPCHLLRMPYEILKPILGKLSQQDQIGVSKTCVTLWELAYPLAYNCITIDISPARMDSTWKYLACGVGLRYVRHLTIRSLYEGYEKPREIEDLVAGTIIAALHISQLLSFSLTTPTSTKTAISIKHVIVLLKTQPSLQLLNLPGINGSNQFLTWNDAQADIKLYNLRSITLFLPPTNPFCDYLSQIARKCSNLQQLHLQFCALIDEHPHQILKSIIDNFPKCSLGSMATRLTLRGYDFLDCSRVQENGLSFPNLKALTLIDCQCEHLLYGQIDTKITFNLAALMIKSRRYLDVDRFHTFIQALKCLRELIVHTTTIELDGLSSAIQQMHNLKLLSLSSPIGFAVFPARNRREALLKIPPATQHLSLGIGLVNLQLPDKVLCNEVSDFLVIVSPLKDPRKCCSNTSRTSWRRLLTLSRFTYDLRCISYVVRGVPGLSAPNLKQIDHGASFEPIIGRAAVNRPGVTAAASKDFSALETLSITTFCNFWPRHVSEDDIHLASGISQGPKSIFSLKPGLTARPATELKEEILQRYAKHSYYFMEGYIDRMMELSWSGLVY